MKNFVAVVFLLMAANVAVADLSRPQPVSKPRSSARLAPPAQDRVRQCVDSCLAAYDRPSYELKRCVASCKAR